MPVIFAILTAIFSAQLAWWRWADLRLQKIKSHRFWRLCLAIFALSQILYVGGMITPRTSHAMQRWIPVPIVAGVYLWSLLVLPASLLAIGACKLLGPLWRTQRRPDAGSEVLRRAGSIANASPDYPQVNPTSKPTDYEPAHRLLSRREILGAAAVALPPLITAGLVARAVPQLGRFRRQSLHLTIPGLPEKLDGIRIAHFSDLHVGRYTRPGQIPAMVDAVNKLQADLVLFTGDLIDMSLDDLPRGIRGMQQINPRAGMALIEGNHDLIDNADEFDRRVREAGLPLLIDQAMTVIVRGQPVQLLGTRWGETTGNRRRANDLAFAQSVDKLVQQRDPDAFPIVLAHHPHTFDAAAAAGFPLILSGHTHGGQLMLSSNLGFGPLFFRYWSGLYTKGASQLVVNNGIGNWFPLRINSPAEIIELTLHRAFPNHSTT